MRPSLRRSVAVFWCASLLGFAAWGWLAARLAACALGEGPAGEDARTALAFGLAGAFGLGAPAALVFGAVMRRVRDGAAWPAALAAGAVLTAAIAVPLRAVAAALPADTGLAGDRLTFLAAAALAMMPAAVAGALARRRAIASTVLPRDAVADPRCA